MPILPWREVMDIYNIEQLLPFVRQKPEFVVLQREGFQVIDYVYQDNNTFDEPMLMECRGIKFCSEGLILARPFRKFFNYGERGADLPVWRPHYITHKLDGSMVHPVLLGRRLFFHTRKGHTDVAKKAERHVLSTPGIDYQGFSYAAIKGGFTPIFEFTSPNNRIVLRYEEDTLTLLAMRHMVSGALVSREMLRDWCLNFKVPLVDVFNMTLPGQVDKFVKHARGLTDAEGYVIYFDDGYMVKIKAEDYVLKHRALDDLGSKKKVVALCAQGFMDDVLPILSEADADELMTFNDALQEEVNPLAERANHLASHVTNNAMSRKAFALNTAPKIKPDWLAGVCFGIMDGRDARMLVLKAIEKHYEDLGIKWRGV
jgi:RNA ligase